MASEEKPAARGTLATVIATAAVTLALGVTAAALGGYLVPTRGADTPPQAVAEPASAPSVVLVPVAREPAQILPPQPEPEVVLAAYEHDGDDDHEDDHEDHDEDDD